jgi:hypothetical protein
MSDIADYEFFSFGHKRFFHFADDAPENLYSPDEFCRILNLTRRLGYVFVYDQLDPTVDSVIETTEDQIREWALTSKKIAWIGDVILMSIEDDGRDREIVVCENLVWQPDL